MPRLILLNGPPASGKSTLAQLYADEHPLALNLDIDKIRSMIGGWRADPAATGLLARQIALAAARTHLSAGHDVVIPQLVARQEFVSQLEALAAACGAEYHEVFVLADEPSAIRQYSERARSLADAVRPDPAISIDLTPEKLAQAHRSMRAFAAGRPAAAVIRTQTGQVQSAYSALLECLSRLPGQG